MNKDERIKELERVAMQLFDMVHESENIQNKIKANDLYDTIKRQSLPIDSVSVTLNSYANWKRDVNLNVDSYPEVVLVQMYLENI